jgi:hypothetical protein
VKRNILYANEKADKNYPAYLDRALKEDRGLGWWEDKKTADKINHCCELPQPDQDEEQIRRERKLRRQAQAYIGNLNTEEREQLRHHALKVVDPEMRKKIETGDYFANVGLKRKMESLVMDAGHCGISS